MSHVLNAIMIKTDLEALLIIHYHPIDIFSRVFKMFRVILDIVFF